MLYQDILKTNRADKWCHGGHIVPKKRIKGLITVTRWLMVGQRFYGYGRSGRRLHPWNRRICQESHCSRPCSGPIIRKTASIKRPQDQPVADDVHVDYTTRWSSQVGTQSLKSEWTKQYSRLLNISNWRTFSAPPQDWPLAVYDSPSVLPEEGITNTLVYQQDIPDISDLPPLPEGDAAKGKVVGEGTIFPFTLRMRWVYFSHMTRDEMLIIKLNDSDQR